MPVPAFHEMMLPLLKLTADGGEHRLPVLAPLVADYFKLTDDDLAEPLPSGVQTRFRNRLAWARVYLGRAGLLETIQRGRFRITERGKKLLATNSSEITLATLKKYPEFSSFVNASPSGDAEEGVGSGDTTKAGTPEETLESAYVSVRSELGRQLLATVMSSSPSFFESLVIDLMLAMGYGGSRLDAAKKLARSGDGGVDGVISEDRLGLDFIYLQAKRWTGSVGSDAVRNFSGSLDSHGAHKGVFITTSTFTASAEKYVEDVKQKKIVLINGQRLTELMMDFNVGVTAAKKFEVKRIDLEYFEEE